MTVSLSLCDLLTLHNYFINSVFLCKSLLFHMMWHTLKEQLFNHVIVGAKSSLTKQHEQRNPSKNASEKYETYLLVTFAAAKIC